VQIPIDLPAEDRARADAIRQDVFGDMTGIHDPHHMHHAPARFCFPTLLQRSVGNTPR
jgi:hypothetical protein